MKLPQYVEKIFSFLGEIEEKNGGEARDAAAKRMKKELVDESLTAKNPAPRRDIPRNADGTPRQTSYNWRGKGCKHYDDSHDVCLDKNPSDLGIVPYSELAMSAGVAGKTIVKYDVVNERVAIVWVKGDDTPVRGLHSEVLSWEIRDKLKKDTGKNPKRWPKGPTLSQETIDKFQELADLQREKPETAMMRARNFMGGGVLSHAIEHVGDINHRMNEGLDSFNSGTHGWGNVMKKARDLHFNRPGDWMSFKKEHEWNMDSNYGYYKEHGHQGKPFTMTREEFDAEIAKRLNAYADEHAKLPVYNKIQWWAREAAISLGRQDFSRANYYLQKILSYDKDLKSWLEETSKYDPDFEKKMKKNPLGRFMSDDEILQLEKIYSSQKQMDVMDPRAVKLVNSWYADDKGSLGNRWSKVVSDLYWTFERVWSKRTGGANIADHITNTKIILKSHNPRLSAGHSKNEYDPVQLARGTKVEMEHTDDAAVAERIAMDHLTEYPNYYEMLETCVEAGHQESANPTNPTVKEIQNVFYPQFEKSPLGQAMPPEERKKLWRDIELFIQKMTDASLTYVVGLQLKQKGGKPGALEFKRKMKEDETGAVVKTKQEVLEQVEWNRYHKLLLQSYLMAIIQRFNFIRKDDPSKGGMAQILNVLEGSKTASQLAGFGNREGFARAIQAAVTAGTVNASIGGLINWIGANKLEVNKIYRKSSLEWSRKYKKLGEKGEENLETYRRKKAKQKRAALSAKPDLPMPEPKRGARDRVLALINEKEIKELAKKKPAPAKGKVPAGASLPSAEELVREALRGQGLSEEEIEIKIKELKKS